MLAKAKDMQAEVTASAHKVWLAGLGALALAQEEGGKLFETLVKRGRDVETRGTHTIRDAGDRAVDAFRKVGKGMDEQVSATLHRLGVPTREDIAALNRRVELLTATIEKLKTTTAAKPKGAPIRTGGPRTTA